MSTMPDDDFAQPAAPGGDKLDLHELNGALLIFEVTEDVEHVQTMHTQPGEKTSAIRADVHVIDGAHAGMVRRDALVFPRVLQGQLRPAVGKKVLGRLGRGVAKPGMSAPWELAPATDADLAAARTYSRRGTAPQQQAAVAPF